MPQPVHPTTGQPAHLRTRPSHIPPISHLALAHPTTPNHHPIHTLLLPVLQLLLPHHCAAFRSLRTHALAGRGFATIVSASENVECTLSTLANDHVHRSLGHDYVYVHHIYDYPRCDTHTGQLSAISSHYMYMYIVRCSVVQLEAAGRWSLGQRHWLCECESC